MDLRIESVELSLRHLINSALKGDEGRLPPHVVQKMDERVKTSAKKNPSLAREQYRSLEGKLELCDLRELQDAVLGKALWPNFVALFGTKELLQSRFGTLADLRNAIRHSRTVDEVTFKEGEAAVIWFERSLDASIDNAESS
jgi:hypothetical protein